MNRYEEAEKARAEIGHYQGGLTLMLKRDFDLFVGGKLSVGYIGDIYTLMSGYAKCFAVARDLIVDPLVEHVKAQHDPYPQLSANVDAYKRDIAYHFKFSTPFNRFEDSTTDKIRFVSGRIRNIQAVKTIGALLAEREKRLGQFYVRLAISPSGFLKSEADFTTLCVADNLLERGQVHLKKWAERVRKQRYGRHPNEVAQRLLMYEAESELFGQQHHEEITDSNHLASLGWTTLGQNTQVIQLHRMIANKAAQDHEETSQSDQRIMTCWP